MTVRALFSMGVNVLGGIYVDILTCYHYNRLVVICLISVLISFN